METLIQWDSQFLLWIQEAVRTPVLNTIFKGITVLGDYGIFWILTDVILLCFKKTRKTGVICLIALAAAWIITCVVLKPVFDRIRPYEVIKGLELLIPEVTDTSFPSGHTSSSFAAACVLLKRMDRRYGIPAVILAALIGFSRLYVGVHYPTDVIVGMLIGIATAYLALRLYPVIRSRIPDETCKRFSL